MLSKIFRKLMPVLFVGACPMLAFGQGDTRVLTFYSELRQENLEVEVWTPPGYQDPGNSKRYPVIYELQVSHLPQYLKDKKVGTPEWEGREVIIAYFNPGGQGCIYSQAHGRSFERVVIDELIPFVNDTLRTLPYRQTTAILGVSKAGGGCTRMATKYAYVFASTAPKDGVIDDCGEEKAFRSYPDKFSILPFDFYEGNIHANYPAMEFMPVHMLAGSDGSLNYWRTNYEYYNQFLRLGLKDVHLYNLADNNSYCQGTVICNDQNKAFSCKHGRLCTDWLLDSAYNALTNVFSFAGGLSAPGISPSGVPEKVAHRFPLTVTLTPDNPGEEIRYTLNGTLPTRQSSLYQGPFTVESAVMVVARSYTTNDSSAANSALLRRLLPPIVAPDTLTGLKYTSFASSEPEIKNNNLDALLQGQIYRDTVIPGFIISDKYGPDEDFAGHIFEGMYMAEQTGRYGFSFQAKGRCRLWVDGINVFERDTIAPDRFWSMGTQVMLEKGMHLIRMEIFSQEKKFFTMVTKPDDPDTIMNEIPASSLFHTSKPSDVVVGLNPGKNPVKRASFGEEKRMFDIRGREVESLPTLPLIYAPRQR